MYMGSSFGKPEEKYRAPRNDMAGTIANRTVELRDEISKNETKINQNSKDIAKLKARIEEYERAISEYLDLETKSSFKL
jgi:predicted  nucleic acid-binding Zn-ribbon protein